MAPDTSERGEPGSGPRTGVIEDAIRRLTLALSRARSALLWERAWPAITAVMAVAAIFLAFSWAGFWLALPPIWRIGVLALFGLVLIASLVPAGFVRWPRRGEALRRLDSSTGIEHRPATTISDRLAHGDEDPVMKALWSAHVERAAARAAALRAGWPKPRLTERDPYALRALVVLALVTTFFMAEGERWKRVTVAFDFSGAIAPRLYRVDAWVTPPVYTGRAPVLLPGVRHDEPAPGEIAAVSVPTGSVLVVRATGLASIELAALGGLAEDTADTPTAAQGTIERRFKIGADGSLTVRGLPAGIATWGFRAVPDRAPTIAHAKDPEVLGRASVVLTYKIEDDYGVTQAEARFTRPAAPAREGAQPPRPLVAGPDFPLVLPQARTHAGTGQTTKNITEHPWAGTLATLVLIARDEAGNEGRSEAREILLPERTFAKPLARALVEQRRLLAFDANERDRVRGALEALLIAPERFTPEPSIYLGVRTAATRTKLARNDDELRSVVDYLWEIAVLIEDGTMSDAEKALRAAEDALRQALERGATEEELKRLTDNLRQALDRFLRALAEQTRRDGTTEARPLDRNARMLRPQDLKNMLDRIESLARSGARDAAKRLLDELQAMLEGLRNRQARGDQPGEMNERLDELGRMIQEQQRLRDRTFREGRDSRADRRNRAPEQRSERERRAMGDLKQNQENLRQQLQRMLDAMKRQRERGDQPEEEGGPGKEAGDALSRAEQAMRDAEGQLGNTDAEGAVDSQGRALESLRRGAQQLARQLAEQQGGPGDGPGDPFGPSPEAADRTDPLGRPVRTREYGDDFTVKVPDEIDVQRARRVLEELRKRLSEPLRPRIELDYLERLLKDF